MKNGLYNKYNKVVQQSKTLLYFKNNKNNKENRIVAKFVVSKSVVKYSKNRLIQQIQQLFLLVLINRQLEGIDSKSVRLTA